jgi:hypothetical protein
MATRLYMTVQQLIIHLEQRLAEGVSPEALVGTYTSTGHLHPVTGTEYWSGTPTDSPGVVKLLTDELSEVDEAARSRPRERHRNPPDAEEC